jgi:hypothetical protein
MNQTPVIPTIEESIAPGPQATELAGEPEAEERMLFLSLLNQGHPFAPGIVGERGHEAQEPAAPPSEERWVRLEGEVLWDGLGALWW